MQANKITKVLMTAGLFALSASVQAADRDLKINFKTIADVSIEKVTDMDFGGDLTLTPGSQCTMAVNATDRPSSSDARIKEATVVGNLTTYQKLSGDCDDGGTGTAGVYKITGAPGVGVDVTVNAVIGGDSFSFVPTALGANYDSGTGGDDLVLLAGTGNDKSGTIKLASGDDIIGGTGGVPIIGQSLLFVGGAITSSKTLDPGTTYTEKFTIDVTY